MSNNYKFMSNSKKPTSRLKSFFLFGTAILVLANAAHCDSHLLLEKACYAIIGGSDLCITPQPFQPSTKDMEFVSKIYTKEQGDDQYGDKFILVQEVPFARYWQLKDQSRYVFHPAVYGRYLFNNAQ